MREVQRSGRRHRLPHLIATTALAIAATMIVAQPAAAKDPVGDGLTTLKPTKKIGKALAKGKVKVKPKGSASAGKKGLEFPVTGGQITPGAPEGKVQHQGSRLQLKKGKTKVTLRNPLINLSKAKLNVGVSGSSLKLFELDYRKAKISRDGFATVYSKVKAKLTKPSAKVLKKGFGLKVKKGTVFGTAKVVADLSAVSLKGGDTTLVPDPDAADALAGAGISLSPIGPATAGPGGFEFPITGGMVSTSDLSGDITHSGGIKFTKADFPAPVAPRKPTRSPDSMVRLIFFRAGGSSSPSGRRKEKLTLSNTILPLTSCGMSVRASSLSWMSATPS